MSAGKKISGLFCHQLITWGISESTGKDFSTATARTAQQRNVISHLLPLSNLDVDRIAPLIEVRP